MNDRQNINIATVTKSAIFVGLCVPMLLSCANDTGGKIVDRTLKKFGQASPNLIVQSIGEVVNEEKYFETVSKELRKELNEEDQIKLSNASKKAVHSGKVQKFKSAKGEKVEARPSGKAYIKTAGAGGDKKKCRNITQKLSKKNDEVVEVTHEVCDGIKA